MEKKAKDILQERAGLIAEASEILDKADAENRDCTAEEYKKFDSLMKKADKLKADADRRSRLAIVEGELDETYQPGQGTLQQRDNIRVLRPGEVRILESNEKLSDLPMPEGRDRRRSLSLGAMFQLAAGYKPRGNFEAERRALSEGSDQSGGFLLTTSISRGIWDQARNRACCLQAGVRTIDMPSESIRVPILENDPLGEWKPEGVACTEDSAMSFKALELHARTLYFLCRISRELMEDAVGLDDFLRTTISKAMGLMIDLGILFGTSAGEQPQGLYFDSDVSKTSATASGYYDDLSDSIYRCQNANYEPNAMMLSPRTQNAFRKLRDGEGRFMPKPDWLPQTFVTRQVSDILGGGADESCVFTGDWSNYLLGVRSQIRIELIKELYAKENQIAFVGACRVDGCAVVASAFDIISGITTSLWS